MMDSSLLHGVLTVVAGIFTGMLSAAFGVGGAVISTPAIRALGVSAAFAIGTTLPSILPSAATGTWRYMHEQMIRWDVVGWAAPAGIVAAVGGSLASKVVPGEGHFLMLLTAGLLGITSWRMGRQGHPEPAAETDAVAAPEHPPPPDRRHDRPAVLAGVGAAAGFLSGLLGVGGGVVMVPGFTELARIPLKTAIASSLACVGLFAVPGTITHAGLGDIDWRTAALLSVGVVPGARLGSYLAMRATDRRLRLSVALFLGLTAVVYAGGELAALSS